MSLNYLVCSNILLMEFIQWRIYLAIGIYSCHDIHEWTLNISNKLSFNIAYVSIGTILIFQMKHELVNTLVVDLFMACVQLIFQIHNFLKQNKAGMWHTEETSAQKKAKLMRVWPSYSFSIWFDIFVVKFVCLEGEISQLKYLSDEKPSRATAKSTWLHVYSARTPDPKLQNRSK